MNTQTRAAIKIKLQECTPGCMQAHTLNEQCVCACGGKNHGIWLRQYARAYRKQQEERYKEKLKGEHYLQ